MSAGYLYILYSEKWDQYYTGSAQDIEFRLEQHNHGRNRSTRGGEPWQLKYSEKFTDVVLARKREYEIKKKKSRKYVEWLIKQKD